MCAFTKCSATSKFFKVQQLMVVAYSGLGPGTSPIGFSNVYYNNAPTTQTNNTTTNKAGLLWRV